MTRIADHETVIELLPWFVNGTLTEDERRAVEHHLRDCLPCRATLKDERRLADAMQLEMTADKEAERNFQRLLDALDRGEPPRRTASRRAAAFPRTAAAAAALLLVAIGAVSWLIIDRGRAPPEPGEYATAADSLSQSGRRVDIVFADGVTEAQIRDLLTTIGGTIVSGPSGVGRYTIRVDDREPLDALIARLKKDPRIRLVSRSFIGSTEQ
jgi:hypothetical protein